VQEQEILSLEQLASEDPDVALLALLYRDALASFDNPVWKDTNPEIRVDSPVGEIPALHESSVNLDLGAFRVLLHQMIQTAGLSNSWPEIGNTIDTLDLAAFAKAVIEWDAPAVDQLANDPVVPPSVLFTIGSCAILPQMYSLHAARTASFSTDEWKASYCPLCGSWPVLAEQRGLEKQLWLRCGRCFSEWRSRHQLCIFCETTDYRKLGYMAAEEERESRRVNTCNECHNYIKVLATISPLQPGELLKRDLESLELDVAATDEGFSRAQQPGCSFNITIHGVKQGERSWFPWR
jgi:FdhE protein